MSSKALTIGLKLANLNPQQLDKVEKLVNKLVSKSTEKFAQHLENAESANAEQLGLPEPQKDPGVHQIKKTNSEPSRLRKQLAEQKITPIKRRGQSGGEAKTYARKEQIYIGARENKFLELTDGNNKIADTSKEDTDFDKKVWKGHKPVPRGKRQAQVEIQCIECNRVFEISPNYPMPESGYVCNDCIVSKRH